MSCAEINCCATDIVTLLASSQGKWVEISFDERTRICGAHIDSYLLEKTRVVQQASEERNYHIFYELVAGATDDERRELELGDAKEFKVRVRVMGG